MFDWINFWCVVAGQLAIFLALAGVQRFPRRRTLGILWRSVLLGLPVGILFDVLIGRHQFIFQYHQVPHDWTFVLLNGGLSYGFAIATAWSLPVDFPARTCRRHPLLPLSLLAISAVLVLSLPQSGTWTLLAMCMLGLALVLTSEAIAGLAGHDGPFMALLDTRLRPFLVIWLGSIVIGLLYELLNAVFPLWSWSVADDMPLWLAEAVIVLFGYAALVVPMFVLSRLATLRFD